MAKEKKLHIAVVMRYNHADSRARLTGVLHALSAHAEVETRVVDSSSSDINRLSSEWPIDGIIFSYPDDIRPALAHGRSRRPALAILDGPRSFHGACVDVRARIGDLTDAVVELFRKRGYRNFAFCGTNHPLHTIYSREVESCFRKSLAAQTSNLGPQPSPSPFTFASHTALSVFHESPDISFSANLAKVTAWVNDIPKPCATLCYSDEIARNLLNACNLAHIHVPEQIAIVGIDDTTEICETTRPTLTSVLPDFTQSGYLAAETLYKHLTSRRKGPAKLSYGILKIVERGSTADLHGCGRLVSAAMELMQTTSLDMLSAEAISRQLHVSRRLLEMHFKKVVGHGVHAEIIRRRLDAILERLRTTRDPIGRIAEDCGFNSYTAAQIAFRKRFGKSMTACRHP